jgi:hypothetical protein
VLLRIRGNLDSNISFVGDLHFERFSTSEWCDVRLGNPRSQRQAQLRSLARRSERLYHSLTPAKRIRSIGLMSNSVLGKIGYTYPKTVAKLVPLRVIDFIPSDFHNTLTFVR